MQKMTEANKEMVGKKIKILIDGKDFGEYYGRSRSDAPEIDQIIWVRGNEKTKTGEFYSVKITDSLESELIGDLI